MTGALLPLPERARLLHIGAMKSGTTALQRAARIRRKALLRHGVRYPGSGPNHFAEVCAFMRLRKDGTVPPLETWQRLMAEVETDDARRILISHEWICEADDAMAQRFIDAVGERTQVAISLRPLTGMVGSYWQQLVKNGVATLPLEKWLTKALAVTPGTRRASRWDRQCDQAGIVERWERLLGADRVTVIVADKGNPDLLFSSFEQLLGLPAGFLEGSGSDGSAANRSLSAPEAELFRRLNVVFKQSNAPFTEYAGPARHDALRRVLQADLGRSEPQIGLPDWAIERATRYGEEIAERLRQSKVTIVGDLAALHAPVAARSTGYPATFDTISMDLAVEAIAGTVAGAYGRGAFFGRKPKAPPPIPQRRQLRDRVERLPLGPEIIRLWHRRMRSEE